MIGHYLLTLTEEQENRVLGERFLPYAPGIETRRCLVDVACSWGPGQTTDDHLPDAHPLILMGNHYDWLCDRFGAPRVNAAIRNRILSNRARRELAPASRETAVVSR